MSENRMEVHGSSTEPWNVTLVNTGEETATGGRLLGVRGHLANESTFCLTYGDGVSDVDIAQSIQFHRKHGKLATVTAVQPSARFGSLVLDGTEVRSFREKQAGDDGWINGGFFVLSTDVLDRIDGTDIMWEQEPLRQIAAEGNLQAYFHRGFWQPMDTLRDKHYLEDLWISGRAPWEDMVSENWRERRVLVTGHTGFKGGWLSLWLSTLKARVCGYALAPWTEPNLFTALRLGESIEDRRGDIRDAQALSHCVREFEPEVVFHLAAQPLVRESYTDPVGTYMTNVVGTANVLEAVRQTPSVRAVVVITTDKCYRNNEWIWGYREVDALGGHDPYSSSKACVEILSASYRDSYFSDAAEHRRVALATARAGNVIGGGDWSRDRLIPDLIRGFLGKVPVHIRSPYAVRPWQHVLEPLAGLPAFGRKTVDRGEGFRRGLEFRPFGRGFIDSRPK